MDSKYVVPFLEALVSVFASFGVSDIKRGRLQKKESMFAEMDITAVIGLTEGIRGNVGYSMHSDTAKKIISTMMGATVTEIDAMGRSAIGELANMITGTAASIFSGNGITANLTPPSIVFGKDVYFIISSVDTISVEMETPFGKIEINIGLEI